MDIYSNGSILVSVEVDDSSYHYEELMNKNVLQLEFSLAKYVEIPAGAYCFHNNRRYELISEQSVTVVNRGNFSYSAVFEAGGARLRKYKIRLISDKRIEFDLSAKASEHVALIVANMNEREGSATNTWTVGTVLTEETDIVKLISYSHNSCLDALNSISSTYETEWEVLESTIDGVLTHTINIGKVEYNKGNNALVLSYGDGTSDQKGGLQSGVQRSSASDSQAIGRLYVECGDRNIELKTYGSKKLHLPCPIGASLAFKFDGKYFEWETGAGKYEADGRVGRYFKTATDGSYVEVDASVGRESYKSDYEESIDLTDIYPKREGEVTIADGVPGGAEESPLLLNVVDDTLNHMTISRITGEQFVIRFIDGPLGGREFGIMDYSPVSNTIYVQQQEEDGYTMPDYAHGFWPVAKYTEDSEGNRTPTGQTPNKYALFGCVMPTAYIYDHTNHTGAEYDALRQACEYLYEHMDKKYALSGTIDDKWLKRKDSTVYGKICKIGGYVKFYDPDILPSQTLVNPFYLTRVLSCKTYINNPYKVEISISNQEVRGSVGNALVKLENNQTHSEQLHRDSLGYSKRGFTDAKETAEMLNAALFDEFTSGIYPVSVQTMQMIAGSEKLQFLFITGLNDATQVACPLSYNASEQTLSSASASYILHKTLGINTIVPEGVRTITDYKRWEIPVWTSAALTDGEKRYYVYAKVVKDSESMTSTGVFLLSETEIAFETSETEEGVTTYYYNLLVGMLNSERDGDRSFVTMYGFTEVLPGQITTDVIRSSDGQSFLNLVANKFHLGASGVNTYIDWNNEEARKLRVRGDIVADTLELEGNTDTQGGVTVTVPSATIKGLMVLKDNNTVNNTVTSFWDGVTSDNVIFGAAYSDAFNKSKTFIANPTSTALADRPDFLLYRDAQNNRVRIYIKDLLVGDTTLTVAERLLALETTLTEMFELDTTSVTGKTLIHAKYGLYSNFQITAGGIGSGGSGGTTVSWGEPSGNTCNLTVASNTKKVMLYPSGTNGHYLRKTANGIEWAAVSAGATDYTSLTNKPSINSVELSGNKSLTELGIAAVGHTHNYLPLTGGTLSGRLTVSEGTSVPLILNYKGRGNDIYAQMRVSDTTYGGLTVSKGSSLRSAIFGVVNNDYKYLGIDAEGNPTYVSSLVSYSLYHNGNANNSSSDWVAKNLTAAAIRGSFISIHPEQSDANILPYFSNDLAFLEKKEGALRIYTTTETDFTIRELTGIDKEVWGRDSLFDGSSAYCGWGNVNSNTVLIFDITLNKVFGATNQFYIDFGNAYWAAKEISVYTAGATGNYTLVSNSHVTNNTNNYYRTSWNGDSKTNVRVVLKGFPNGSGRIAEIGMINYNSTLGRETFMSRGCDDDIYRNLTPNATNTYALGSASKRWNNVYANAIDASGNVNVEGDLSCDGLTVGDNPLPSTNGTISLGNTSHYWKNVYAKEVTFNEGISIAFNSDTGGMTASGTFEVQSELSAQSLNITEDAGISGNLSVAGGTETTTLSVTGNASVGGNASIGGNITPSGTPANQNIGSTSAVWGKIYANKWYPKANDANTYIEYVTSGNTGYFAVHGNIYASGAITAASSL